MTFRERSKALRDRPRLSLGLLLALLCLLGLVGFVATCGEVYRTEFSPQTFKHRGVRYHQVPLLGLGVRVTPMETAEWSTPLVDYLQGEGFLKPASDQEWTLVKGFAWDVRGWHGSAKYLCRELGCWGGEDEKWVVWSRAHPEVAKEVWRLVVDHARKHEYGEACEVLHFAKGTTGLEQFRERLRAFREER